MKRTTTPIVRTLSILLVFAISFYPIVLIFAQDLIVYHALFVKGVPTYQAGYVNNVTCTGLYNCTYLACNTKGSYTQDYSQEVLCGQSKEEYLRRCEDRRFFDEYESFTYSIKIMICIEFVISISFYFTALCNKSNVLFLIGITLCIASQMVSSCMQIVSIYLISDYIIDLPPYLQVYTLIYQGVAYASCATKVICCLTLDISFYNERTKEKKFKRDQVIFREITEPVEHIIMYSNDNIESY